MKEPQDSLLSDFKPASYEEWKDAAEKLLKGAPFEKRMLTKTPEGIVLQPIYLLEDCEDLPQMNSFPGSDDFVRGGNSDGYTQQAWGIAQEQPYGDAKVLNKALLQDLAGGQDSVNIVLDGATRCGLDPDEAAAEQIGEGALSLSSLENLSDALKDVRPDFVPIYLNSGTSGLAVQALFMAWVEGTGVDAATVKGGLKMDPLGSLVSEGTLAVSVESLYDELALLVKNNAKDIPNFAAAGVSGLPYHNAGASATQELASVLASGLSYLRAMGERGVSIDDAASQITFTLSIGGNFFMEVSKFRAARMLWSRIVKELGGSPKAQGLRLHVRTGLYNKTKLDPYVNMLRCSTEALSAVVGGAEAICVGTFDETIRMPSDFSRRIARNVQVILQEECELTAVIDPGGGSWYIESLTNELATSSWALFQELEKEGGILESLKSGSWQDKIAATRKGRENLLDQRRSSLIGTNQYPNIQEVALKEENEDALILKKAVCEISMAQRMSVDLDDLKSGYTDSVAEEKLAKLVAAAGSGATVGALTKAIRGDGGQGLDITALDCVRLAQRYEALRDAATAFKETSGNAPSLFLANLGLLKKHKIRADFTRSFFASGGFEALYSEPDLDDAQLVEAFLKSGTQIAVICGTDRDYAERVPDLIRALKKAAPDAKVILAGFPGDLKSTFEEAGLDDFIFVKSNNYEVNRTYLELIGAL